MGAGGAPGADLEHLNEWTGKLRASVLRIAALLHHANHNPNTTIDPTTMTNAIQIGDYYLEHARHIADRWGTDNNIKQARHILDWFTRINTDTFTVRDLYSTNRRTFPTGDDTRQPLELLHERGWIRPLFDGPLIIGRRGKDSPRFAIHPSCVSCAHKPYTETEKDTTNSVTHASHASHASHVYTPPGGQVGAMRRVPKQENQDNIHTYNSLSNPPTPCAHETHETHETQDNTNNPPTPPNSDDLGLF